MHDARTAVRLRAPQERANARGELRHGERFHHVVVGAEVEAAHAVIHRVARGEHEHGHRPVLVRRAGAQAAQHLEAIHLRKPDVEDHKVEALLRGGKHGLLAPRGDVDGVSLGFEDPPQPGGERRVVFYD